MVASRRPAHPPLQQVLPTLYWRVPPPRLQPSRSSCSQASSIAMN